MMTVLLVVLLALLLAAWLAPAPSPRRAVALLRCPFPPAPLWRGEHRGWAGGRL